MSVQLVCAWCEQTAQTVEQAAIHVNEQPSHNEWTVRTYG